jgi:hypothetical protein
MDVSRRRMRNDDVNSTFPPDPGTQALYLPVHFPFGILVRPAIVPARTFQSQNIFPPESNQVIGQIDTARWGAGVITQVMVAAHKIKRYIQLGANKRKVFRRQIAAGENQVNVFKPPAIKLIMQNGFNPV